ncbi:MAG: motility associated factor glycosyltransferase family protein [Bacteroidales bacterium]|nr:motility associated factor glycosyltransferase family protein [Bacteroidales bacterium]
MKKTDGVLAKKLEETIIPESYKVFSVEQFSKNILFQDKGFEYYNNQNPLYDTKKEIDSLDTKNAQIAIFLGIGLGYELFYYNQNIVQREKTKFVCVIERDVQLFKIALYINDFTPFFISPKVSFFVGEDSDQLFTKFVKFMGDNQKFVLSKAIKAVYHSSSLKLNKDYYIKALKVFKEAAINKIMDFGNSPSDSLVGIENMLSNLDEIINNPGIILLKNKFKGKPAIVAATGPSLDKNKHLLKGLEEKALIVAPEASLKPLLKSGIKPHLITSLERVLPVIDLIKNLNKKEVEDVYFAAAPVIDREVYKEYPGKKLIVYRNLDHFKWLGIDKGILDIKITAGNMAFKVCEYLGCDPIILIGQDLANSEDGITHAKGFALSEDGSASKAEKYRNETQIRVKGNIDELVTTTPTWLKAINAYRRDVDDYKGRCVNSTEGGAYIEGTEVIPFQEAIEKYVKDEYHPMSLIKKNLHKFERVDTDFELKKINNLIQSTKSDIDYLIENHKKQLNKLNDNKQRLLKAMEEDKAMEMIKPELNSLNQYFFQHKTEVNKERNFTVQYYLAHVFQSVNIQNMITYYDIPNHYDDPDRAKIAQILWNEKWYVDMINIITIAKESLVRAEEMLKSGKWERSNLNVEFHRGQMEPSEFKRLFPEY